MRAVLDTNVLLSGLLWRGTPHALLDQVRAGTLILISSPTLLAEFGEVIRRPKFQAILVRAQADPERTVDALRQLAEIMDPPPLPAPISQDPDDDAVLALAAASKADLIVSGDRHLLALGHYQGVPILDPAAALRRVQVDAAGPG